MTSLQHTLGRLTGGPALLAACTLALAGCGTPGAAPSSSASTSASAAFNDADAMFAQMMIPHHQQALQMSETLLAKPGLDPRVGSLAQQIKAAQAPEITTLKGWLSSWGRPESMPVGHSMHGMLSETDLGELGSADAAAASKLFLTRMIAHHEGAVSMAQVEKATGRHEGALAMASAIIASQSKEIDEMRSLVARL